jgi:hypothetical protein
VTDVPSVVPPPRNYQREVMDVLKATAISRTTISTGDLAWAVNYQRTSRPIEDVLAALRPVLEDHAWPPLTCLVVLSTPSELPALEVDRAADVRMQQRGCWSWARMMSDERQRLRGAWLENSAAKDGA